MSRRLASAALVLVLASVAGAHDAPIPPSDSVFETIVVEAPGLGLRADAAPAGGADASRILFDTGANVAQLETGALPARALSGDMTGTLAFRSLFDARLRSSGELVADDVPLALVLDGGTANVRVTLTTGLAASGDTMVEGAALGADGRFTLVGVTSSDQLLPPLAGAMLVLRLAGRVTPTPDLDGFAPAALTKRVTAKLARNAVRVRAVFDVPLGNTPDFPGRPARVRISSGDATIGTALLSGLSAQGRRFTGESGGVTVSARAVRKKPMLRIALDVSVAQPLATPVAGAPIDLTYDVGGLLARGSGERR